MSAAAIVTLVGITLTVLALALYLVHVIVLLRKASFALGTVVAGLRAIEFQTRPVGPVVAQVNADLATVKQVLEDALGTELTGESMPAEDDEVATSA